MSSLGRVLRWGLPLEQKPSFNVKCWVPTNLVSPPIAQGSSSRASCSTPVYIPSTPSLLTLSGVFCSQFSACPTQNSSFFCSAGSVLHSLSSPTAMEAGSLSLILNCRRSAQWPREHMIALPLASPTGVTPSPRPSKESLRCLLSLSTTVTPGRGWGRL